MRKLTIHFYKKKSSVLILALLTTLFLSACKDKPKDENTESSTAECDEEPLEDIVTYSLTDKDGKEGKQYSRIAFVPRKR